MKKIFFLTSFLLFSLFVDAQVMFGEVDYTKTLNYHGNYLTFSKPVEVTILGKKRTSTPSPLTLNGEKIYNFYSEGVKPPHSEDYKLTDYIFNAIKTDLERLPDGNYMINLMNLVVDKKGALAYFDFDSLKMGSGHIKTFSYTAENITNQEVTPTIQDLISHIGMKDSIASTPQQDSINNVLINIPKDVKLKIYLSLFKALKTAPPFKPAERNGKPANYLLTPGQDYVLKSTFVIKNHKATLLKTAHQ